MNHIGIVMPTFNQVGFIAAALGSVVLQHGAPPHTLVVVDDGSTDGTREFLGQHGPRKVITHEVNKGAAGAINTGVEWLTQALTPEVDALTWVSSDNEMDWEWLAALSKVMDKRGAGVAYGGFWWVSGSVRRYLFRQHTPDHLVRDLNCYYGPAFLIRRDVWLEAGQHRGKISHDYDHWLRVEEVCFRRGLPIVGVDKPLCTYNAHPARATETRKHEFDAHLWREEARKRRGLIK